MPKYAYPEHPMGDPEGRWDWDTDYNLPLSEWVTLCRWLQQAGKAVGLCNQNLKFDLAHFRNGTRFSEGVELEKYAVWDTMLASPIVWPYAGTTALKPVAARIWGDDEVAEAAVVQECLKEVSKRYGLKPSDKRYDLMPASVNLPYASQDAVLTLRLAELQHLMLADGYGLHSQVKKAVDLMRVLRRMERRGLGPLDIETSTKIADEIDERIAILKDKLPFEPHTGPRAATYFFDELKQKPWKVNEERRQIAFVPVEIKGVPTTKRKVIKQGDCSAVVAKRMAEQDVPAAAEWAEITELRIANQMFYRNYANLVGPDGQLRAALPLDEPVLTPTGWSSMGNLRVGDFVIGSDGCATKIVEIPFKGDAKVWEIQTGDGAVIRCSDNHLWTVRTFHQTNHVRKTGERVKWQTLTTSALRDLLKKDKSVNLPDLPVIEYDTNLEELPIHPYLLGVLLGDGYLNHTPSWTAHKDDMNVMLPYLLTLTEDTAYSVSRGGKYPNSYATRFSGGNIARGLRELNLLPTRASKDVLVTGIKKFVPEQYLRANKENRLALLRGLLDTDGCAHKEGHVRFNNTCENLVNAVIELVRSLGGIARKWGYQPRPGVRRAWYVSIRMQDESPFWLPRKTANWKRPNTKNRKIISVKELDETTQMQCITVSAEDGLFVTKDYVLTHNSFNQAFVRSGRLSASRVQLHGMPKKLGLKLDGRELLEPRKLILTPPGKVRMNLDLSQAELRLGALFCDCTLMANALAQGEDLHAITAQRVLGASPDHPDWKLKRDAGKQGNFSCIYGVGPTKFQTILWERAQIEWTLQQAKGFVYSWRDTYHEFQTAYHYWLEFAERKKYIPLFDGSVSWMTLPRDFSNSAWNRQVQGGLAIFVRDWLIMIEKKTARYDALELSVHDSACLLLPEDCADEICIELAADTETMWTSYFGIPGRADVSRWG